MFYLYQFFIFNLIHLSQRRYKSRTMTYSPRFNRKQHPYHLDYQQNPYIRNYNVEFKRSYSLTNYAKNTALRSVSTSQKQKMQTITRKLRIAKENQEIYKTLLGFTSLLFIMLLLIAAFADWTPTTTIPDDPWPSHYGFTPCGYNPYSAPYTPYYHPYNRHFYDPLVPVYRYNFWDSLYNSNESNYGVYNNNNKRNKKEKKDSAAIVLLIIVLVILVCTLATQSWFSCCCCLAVTGFILAVLACALIMSNYHTIPNLQQKLKKEEDNKHNVPE